MSADIPFCMSPRYQSMFDALLEEVAQNPKVQRRRANARPQGLFWPQRGEHFRAGAGLMVVGRATNGWGEPFDLAELTSPDRRRFLVDQARETAQSSPDWGCVRLVNNINPYSKGGTIGTRSAFWRVVRQVAYRLAGQAKEVPEWWTTVAWSNLAKIAPAKSGNPPNWLGMAQGERTLDLVEQEVRE